MGIAMAIVMGMDMATDMVTGMDMAMDPVTGMEPMAVNTGMAITQLKQRKNPVPGLKSFSEVKSNSC